MSNIQSRLRRASAEHPSNRLAAMAGDMEMDEEVLRDITSAQRKLASLARKVIRAAPPRSEWSTDGKPNGRVEVEKGTSAYRGTSVFTTVREGPVPTVRVYWPHIGYGARAEYAEGNPTVTEVGRAIGLPLKGGQCFRLTLYAPPADFLVRSWAESPRGTTVAKFYYSVEGYGGIGSGFAAVKPDGSWIMGGHG